MESLNPRLQTDGIQEINFSSLAHGHSMPLLQWIFQNRINSVDCIMGTSTYLIIIVCAVILPVLVVVYFSRKKKNWFYRNNVLAGCSLSPIVIHPIKFSHSAFLQFVGERKNMCHEGIKLPLVQTQAKGNRPTWRWTTKRANWGRWVHIILQKIQNLRCWYTFAVYSPTAHYNLARKVLI